MEPNMCTRSMRLFFDLLAYEVEAALERVYPDAVAHALAPAGPGPSTVRQLS